MFSVSLPTKVTTILNLNYYRLVFEIFSSGQNMIKRKPDTFKVTLYQERQLQRRKAKE